MSLHDPRARTVLTALAFFLSGVAALVYQTIWQRILAFHTGIGLRSVALIVASFMLGLGLGSHLGGLWSRRLGGRRSLLAFSLLELAIGAFGAASGWIFYDVLYVRGTSLSPNAWLATTVAVAGLAVPTTLMGMSLPLLVQAVVRDARTAGATIGFLYAVNVLGAAAGAIAGPTVLVRFLGMRTALVLAGIANVVAGLCALALVSAARGAGEDVVPAGPADDAEAPERGLPFAGWATLYAFSGFCALGLEMVWFRVMEVSVKASAFTFGALLAVYLLGNGLGSLLGARLRVRQPLRVFLLAQCALLAWAAGALSLLVKLPVSTPGLAWFVAHWGGHRVLTIDSGEVAALLKLYVLMPVVLFGPSTLLMGLSYPVLQKAVQDDARSSGLKVGLLQAVNIAGCMVGSLLVGIVLLNEVGTTGALRVLLACGLVLAGVGLRVFGTRSPFPAAAAVLLLVFALVPSGAEFWRRFHGALPPDSRVAEDATGVVVLAPDGDRSNLWAGGRHHSSLPFGGAHTVLGAAPAVVHPSPRRVAVIGLGSGDTAWAAGCRQDVEQSIDVYELYAQEHALLSRAALEPGAPPALVSFLRDPRFRFLVQDGRAALLRAGAEFDVIEMDALWPVSPYSGNLYSVEFYRMAAARLRRGGLMCVWTPTARARASFGQAFPHVVALPDGITLGSAQPIPIDLPAWRRRLYSPNTRPYLDAGGGGANAIWAALSRAEPVAPRAAAEVEVNRDLFPRDEFVTPRGR